MLPSIPKQLHKFIDKRDFRAPLFTHRVSISHLYYSGKYLTYSFAIYNHGLSLDQLSKIIFRYADKCLPVLLPTLLKDEMEKQKTHRVIVREILEDRTNGHSKTKSYRFPSHSSKEIAVMLEKLCCHGYSKLEERNE